MNFSILSMKTRIAAVWMLSLVLTVVSVEASVDTAVQTIGASQTPPGSTPARGSSLAVLPAFSEEEAEDLGLQWLLLERRHLWWQVSVDNQFSLSNNPLLLDSSSAGSSLNVLTLGGQFVAPPYAFAGGILSLRAGITAAWYHYGFFTGRDRIIAGLPVKENDFEALSPYLESSWQRGNWFLLTGLRYNRLTQGALGKSSKEFYRDWQPSLLVAHRLPVANNTDLWVQLQTEARLSKTESFDLLPNAWNDRWSQSVGLMLNHFAGGAWLLQVRYQYQYAYYLQSTRDRTDHLHTASLSATRSLTQNLQLRTFLTFERRFTSDPTTSEYRKTDAGLTLFYARDF